MFDHLQDRATIVSPSGVVPNQGEGPNRADLYIILCSIVLAVTFLFVSLRLYVKIWITHAPGWDDGEFAGAMYALA